MVSGNIQGQAGRGLEQSGLVKGVPAHGRAWKEVFKGAFQPKPFDDCKVLGYGESC